MAQSTGKITINNSSFFIIKQSTIIALFIIVPFFIDQIQGYITLVLLSNFPFSLFFKLVYMCIFFIFLLKYNKLNYTVISLGFICIVLLSMLSTIDSTDQITKNFSSLAKLLYFPISFFFFKTIFLHKNYSALFIYQIFSFLFWALSIAILASVFGIGTSQYGENVEGVSIGFSGYFFAGNELGPLAVMFYACVLNYQIHTKTKMWKLLLTFGVGLVTCTLIATKVSIGGFLIMTLLIPFYMNITQSVIAIKSSILKFYLALMSGGVAIIGIFIFTFKENLLAYFNRLSFYYERADTLVAFLASGRDKRVQGAIDIYVDQYSWFEKLFGTGDWYKVPLAASLHRPHIESVSAEIDPLDLLLSLGLIGGSALLFFWFYCAYHSYRISLYAKSSYYSTPFLIIAFFLATSFSAGHIFSSSMLGFYLSIILAYTFTTYTKIKDGNLQI